MMTFDVSLFELYDEGAIGYDEAIRNADSANELRLNIKLQQQARRSGTLAPGGGRLSARATGVLLQRKQAAHSASGGRRILDGYSENRLDAALELRAIPAGRAASDDGGQPIELHLRDIGDPRHHDAGADPGRSRRDEHGDLKIEEFCETR